MHRTPPPGGKPSVDLTNCDREPIHLLGHVQSFGCLLAVSSDWFILHASINVAEVFGWEAEDLIGKRFVDYFPEQTTHHLRSRFQILANQTGVARVYGVDLFGDGRHFDVAIHRADRHLVFEFMPRADVPKQRDDTALVQALIGRLRRAETVAGVSQEAARALQALTGMDRVMVYRFERDGSGTVIAEAMRGTGESYLGLRYPASDIPQQARALYKRNLIRIIADVASTNYPIIPEAGAGGTALDLSMAVTRSVSPIHLEYLQNMGVAASMSVSILRRGELWGLFACHHNAPLLVDYERRSAVELFAQLFSYELAQIETNAEFADIDRAAEMHDRLTSRVSSGETLLSIFTDVADEIASVIDFDGIAVYSNGHYRAQGMAPSEEEFMGLARFLNTAQSSEIYVTDSLVAAYPQAEIFADRVAGILALPISRRPRDYLVLFRRELADTVRWAGNPEKPVELGPNGIRLTPRKSFAVWQEVVRGHCAPWKDRERRAAESLRVTLLEVVLKLSDEANASRKRADEQKELLIAELNHRVRNILNLIRGLVSQGRGGALTVEDYARSLDHRIHALARAHDQLTRQEWTWASLRALIRTEVEAFLAGKAGRVQITGADVNLSPQAFTTLALLVHELVTNSAKYGALCDGSGGVEIDIGVERDGSAVMTWRESGGPPVKAPSRKGFGTTIIQHSVPFELKGTADVDFKVTGLEARFLLPAAHVARVETASRQDEQRPAQEASSSFRLKGPVLIVEDNLIIAMDGADMLAALGAAPVYTASNTREAIRLIETHPLAVAILDVNLGDENSLPAAQACLDRGIPIIFATGYGAEGSVMAAFPKTVIVRKPYTIEQIQAALEQVLGISGAGPDQPGAGGA